MCLDGRNYPEQKLRVWVLPGLAINACWTRTSRWGYLCQTKGPKRVYGDHHPLKRVVNDSSHKYLRRQNTISHGVRHLIHVRVALMIWWATLCTVQTNAVSHTTLSWGWRGGQVAPSDLAGVLSDVEHRTRNPWQRVSWVTML